MNKRPEREKIFLAQLNREVFMNFISLADDEWMTEQFGAEKLRASFTAEGFDLRVILALFWRLLDVDAKRAIAAVRIHKEEKMVVKEIEIDDPVDKLKYIISGQAEIERIIGAIVQMRIKSNPQLLENLKKKVKEDEDSATNKHSTL